MKRIIAAVLACLMVVILASCGTDNGTTNSTSDAQNSSEITGTNASNPVSPNTAAPNPAAPNPVELAFHPSTSPDAGAYATIKVSADIKFDDETAWLGLCPAGKDYITEPEVDDVDVVWYHADATESETDPHVFACDFSDVEDGTYALVVTSSDDENIGYVIIQLEMTKKGDSLTFNYDNAKINERPTH